MNGSKQERNTGWRDEQKEQEGAMMNMAVTGQVTQEQNGQLERETMR